MRLCSWSIPGSADLIKYFLPIDLLYYVGENAYIFKAVFADFKVFPFKQMFSIFGVL